MNTPTPLDAPMGNAHKAGDSEQSDSGYAANLREDLWNDKTLKKALQDAVARGMVGYPYAEFTELITQDDEVGDEEDLQSIDEQVNLMLHLFTYYNNTNRLLDALPATIRIDESDCWLNLNKTRDGYQAGYLHGDGIYEKSLNFVADTPSAALQRLMIQLEEVSGLVATDKEVK